mmetsp:Transcript_37292/g.79512  ORF Transcript_37292/g.79512 Transcript_37292/m.79512 type:complete len:248 (+) Transcript_37292:245-988(+)
MNIADILGNTPNSATTKFLSASTLVISRTARKIRKALNTFASTSVQLATTMRRSNTRNSSRKSRHPRWASCIADSIVKRTRKAASATSKRERRTGSSFTTGRVAAPIIRAFIAIAARTALHTRSSLTTSPTTLLARSSAFHRGSSDRRRLRTATGALYSSSPTVLALSLVASTFIDAFIRFCTDSISSSCRCISSIRCIVLISGFVSSIRRIALLSRLVARFATRRRAFSPAASSSAARSPSSSYSS